MLTTFFKVHFFYCDFFFFFLTQEKKSFLNYNVSCILSLPAYMKQGYGKMLIDFSKYLYTMVKVSPSFLYMPFYPPYLIFSSFTFFQLFCLSLSVPIDFKCLLLDQYFFCFICNFWFKLLYCFQVIYYPKWKAKLDLQKNHYLIWV